MSLSGISLVPLLISDIPVNLNDAWIFGCQNNQHSNLPTSKVGEMIVACPHMDAVLSTRGESSKRGLQTHCSNPALMQPVHPERESPFHHGRLRQRIVALRQERSQNRYWANKAEQCNGTVCYRSTRTNIVSKVPCSRAVLSMKSMGTLHPVCVFSE